MLIILLAVITTNHISRFIDDISRFSSFFSVVYIIKCTVFMSGVEVKAVYNIYYNNKCNQYKFNQLKIELCV